MAVKLHALATAYHTTPYDVARWPAAKFSFNETCLLTAQKEIAQAMKGADTMVFPTISAEQMVALSLWCDDG